LAGCLVKLGTGVSHSPSMVITAAVGGTADSDGALLDLVCDGLAG
jgi:hypothetical protein